MYDRISLVLYFSAALMLMGCPKKVKSVEGETIIEVEELPVEDEELPEADDPKADDSEGGPLMRW